MQILDKYFVISVFPSKCCNGDDSFKTVYAKNYEYKQHIKSSSIHYSSKYIKSLSVSKFANMIDLLARTRWGLDLL